MSRKGYTMLIDEDSGSTSHRSESHRDKRVQDGESTVGLLPQVQNTKGKNVYVFSDGRVANDEDDNIELTSLTKRGNTRTYKATSASSYLKNLPDDIVIKELPLLNEDTLQSLSIKFRCSVTDIKRVNGLMSDQEFYGCRMIKIPVRSHQSILQQELEQLAKERAANPDAKIHRPRCTADAVSSEVSDDDTTPEPRSPHMEDIFIPHDDTEDSDSVALLDRTDTWANNKSRHHNGAERDRRKFDKIISRKDHEIREIQEKMQKQTNALEEVTAVMRTPPYLLGPQPPQQRCPSLTPSLSCVVISAVLMLVVVPTLVFLWYRHIYQKNISDGAE